MADRLLFVFAMAALTAWLIMAKIAEGRLVDDDRVRPPRVFRVAMASGRPPAEKCENDRRHLGTAVLIRESREICVCFGEAHGWQCMEARS